MITRIKLLTLATLLTAGAAFGQSWGPKEPFKLNLDLARFRGGEDTLASVELYYSFSRTAVTYLRDSAGMASGADLALYVRRGDSLYHADRWLVPYRMQDTLDQTPGMALVGSYHLHLPAGMYSFKIFGRDRNDARRMDSVSFRVPVRPVGPGDPAMSDIQFASMIRQGNKSGPFYKNTLDVIPNVGGLYSEDQSCFFYAEAYNLLEAGDTSKYTVHASVTDAVGRELSSRERPPRRRAESCVIVDQFPVSNLRTGTYTLTLALLDTGKKVLTSSGRKFFVLNKSLGVDSAMLTAGSGLPLPEYMSMDEAELDREFKWSTWEAASAEKEQYEKLQGIDAKRRYLTDFWKKRGPGVREEYLARAAYANANFGAMRREGYRSDRGRVHIMYGVPDDVERHPNETDMRPYEVWSYHAIQGGVVFVFVQRSTGGDYELLHSTHRNELHNENWMNDAYAR